MQKSQIDFITTTGILTDYYYLDLTDKKLRDLTGSLAFTQ